MSGVLYIVATPIGNLGDITLRGIETLRSAALIAAEDTRHSRHLLNYHGIDTPMVSCHEHNERKRCEEILARLEAGDDVALISDAGTPLVSDPGYLLVQAARACGYRVSPVPGASSAVAALSASGLPTARFHFCGFLTARGVERDRQLGSLAKIDATLVLFEAGNRIMRLLRELDTVFRGRPCAIAKELTKLHERFLNGDPRELLRQFETDDRFARGEFVVLIDNTSVQPEPEEPGKLDELLEVLLAEVSLSQAVKIAQRLCGGKKNDIYRRALEIRERAGLGLAD